MYYKPRTDFFKTFGIQPAEGYTVEQLEEAALPANSMLLSEDGANELYGSNRSNMRASLPPRYLSMVPDWKDKEVTGVFKPFKMNNGNRAIPVAFYKFSKDDNNGTDVPAQTYILVRVKEGVNLDKTPLSEVDPSSVGWLGVMGLLTAAVSEERRSCGKMKALYENGSLLRWLTELKKADEAR